VGSGFGATAARSLSPEESARGSWPPEARARPTTETRTCSACEGEGYVPLDVYYRPDTGRLVIVGGLCVACKGEGVRVVYLYRGGGA
jgi:hypothetical protein